MTRTGANTCLGYGVYLDDARLNNHPNAVVFAQHVYQSKVLKSPMGGYNTLLGKWAAFNEDTSVAFRDGESVSYWVVQ